MVTAVKLANYGLGEHARRFLPQDDGCWYEKRNLSFRFTRNVDPRLCRGTSSSKFDDYVSVTDCGACKQVAGNHSKYRDMKTTRFYSASGDDRQTLNKDDFDLDATHRKLH